MSMVNLNTTLVYFVIYFVEREYISYLNSAQCFHFVLVIKSEFIVAMTTGFYIVHPDSIINTNGYLFLSMIVEVANERC